MKPRQKDKGVTPELRATATADATVELQKAIQKQDYRFLGVAGYGATFPGIKNDRNNLTLRIHGYHIIDGTSDYIESPEQLRLQPVAAKYAERYNRLLVEYIGQGTDPAIAQAQRKIEQELTRLEHSDPVDDAKKAIQVAVEKGWSVNEILPPGGGGVRAGIDRKLEDKAVLAGILGFTLWDNVFIVEIMTLAQRQRLEKLVASYAVPFNRYLLSHTDEVIRKKRR